MSKHRTAICLIMVWLCIFASLILLDFYILRYPILNQNAAVFRIIPPSLTTVEKVTSDMTTEEIIALLGYPTSADSSLSSSGASWDLQFGYRVRLADYGGGTEIVFLSAPFVTFRWLIFPCIMIAVAIVELVYYRNKKRKDNRTKDASVS